MGPSFLIAMVPEAIHNPIAELWNCWLQGCVFRLLALSQQWQNHHNGQIRAVRTNPQDKRKAEKICQQKIKAASHMPQVYLWSWWALKSPIHFSYYLPIICAKCVLVYIWITNTLYSAPLLNACWPGVPAAQDWQAAPSPVQGSYPGCLHRRSPQIKCVWGPAWSARTNPPGRARMRTAASLQTHTISCTRVGEEGQRGEWCS